MRSYLVNGGSEGPKEGDKTHQLVGGLRPTWVGWGARACTGQWTLATFPMSFKRYRPEVARGQDTHIHIHTHRPGEERGSAAFATLKPWEFNA